MNAKTMGLIVSITTLLSPKLHAAGSGAHHIRDVGENTLQNNFDTLVSKQSYYGSLRWSYIDGNPILKNIEGDRSTKATLKELYRNLDHSQLDQISVYHINVFIDIVSSSDYSGIDFGRDHQTGNTQTFSFRYKLLDPCTQHIKTGGYKRDRWTNYIQGAGMVAAILTTGYVGPVKTCTYNDKTKSFSK